MRKLTTIMLACIMVAGCHTAKLAGVPNNMTAEQKTEIRDVQAEANRNMHEIDSDQLLKPAAKKKMRKKIGDAAALRIKLIMNQ